jgi:hypothetical protein
MIDGAKRKRRNGMKGGPRRQWYAFWRATRFADRFGCGQQRVVILAGVRSMSPNGSFEVIIEAHHGCGFVR